MVEFRQISAPKEGGKITIDNGKLTVPSHPIICFIEGDGVGKDVSNTMRYVVDAAVEKAYSNKKKIVWFKIPAGEAASNEFGNALPEDTINAIREYKIAIKGPLTTPVGGGHRSLNVTLRQKFDLFACVRPVKYIPGTPNPMKNPERLDVVIFRENTEDVYAGIEWKQGTDEAKKVIKFLNKDMGNNVREDSGIGIKPISIAGTKRLVRAALKYAIDNNRKSVTLMHKGNIMKFTEGAFKQWGYELAKDEFADKIVIEGEPESDDKIVLKDRIADSMFQQILLRPDEYDIIATSNLNGDYISDAAAAQVGGLGMAPGANINYDTGMAIFEATHGSAPKHAGEDKANPGSIILSAVMMLEYIGWKEAAGLITKGIEKTIRQKKVTYDLHRQMENATLLKCSEFGNAIVENM